MHRFSQVDVFTDRLTQGNPVAVVHAADDIDESEMAAFARWTNLSETTFLLSPTTAGADYRLRIFTPRRELPFAGHPTLGSARAWLAAGGNASNPGQIIQDCGAGRVALRESAGRLAFAAPPLLRSGPVAAADVEQIADALRLSHDAIVDSQWADNGPGWVAVLLDSAEAVMAVEPDTSKMEVFSNIGVVGPYPPDSDVAFELRAFMRTSAGSEDPVTGSLNASVARWLIDTGRAPTRYVAAQGTALGRRGRIHIESSEDGLWIGGDTVIAVTGEVAL